MGAIHAVLIALVTVLLSASNAAAGSRVALVVGISSYKHVPRLINPANDAAAIAGVFRKAGFDTVEMRSDLGIAELRKSFRDFSEIARNADTAVVYYAGHGIEVDGQNYLIAADAKLNSDFDVEDEAISLDRVLKALEPAKQLRLVILDACRDNPFANTMKRTVASRSIGRGLAKVEPALSNTLVAYAAKAGAVATDGEGSNSPFAVALVKHIAVPGLDLRLAFGRVRDDVAKATSNKQEPFVYGSLGGDIVALVPAPAIDPTADARRDYEFAAQIGTRKAWESFLATHKSGFYTDLARAQFDKLNTAEEAKAKAEQAKQQAEVQAKAKADEFRRQLEEHGARQAEEARRQVSEQARRELEETRRQAAEQAKRELDEARQQVAEAQRQADEARRQVEAAKQQAVDDARRQIEIARSEAEDRARAELKARMTALDAGNHPAPPAPQAPTMDSGDIARLLQAHLKRVGCDPGNTDGDWNSASRKSLEQFNTSTGSNFDVKIASHDALDAVRAKAGRVCPLVCAKGQRAENDRCVQITCENGFVLGSNGVCGKRPGPSPKVARNPGEQSSTAPAAPSSRGSKCFSFNGRQYCE